MSGYDLHTHSVCSDGTATVTENVTLAIERGLDGIAVTDHDTTEGLEEAFAAAAASGTDLEIVPGIEFSAEYAGSSLHVLSYWPDPDNAELKAELKRLSDTRFRRGEMMIEKLQELGYEISFERVREIAGGGLIARPHVATAMVEAGVVATEKEAFDRFISDDGIAYVPKHALDPVEALALIKAAGGAQVLAHPGMWKGEGSVPDVLIEQMAAEGMVGLEVDHPDHDETQRAYYRATAERLDLVPTGASDCHGARYDFRLGCETTDAERFGELKRRAGALNRTPVARIERVAEPDDPRLRDFTALRDVQLRTRREADEGFFLAEGATTIERALRAGYVPRAFLVTERWLPSVTEPARVSEAPILVVADELLDATTGFHVHRGALASMHRRALPALEDVLDGAARVVVLEDLSDHTNLGAVFRSAAALGFDAILLTPRCADSLYRRAVRTSMGAVFALPWTRIPWFEGPDLLKAQGFELAALTPGPDAVDLRDVHPEATARLVLALGSEGHGLSERWLHAADLRVRIPMRNGVDSLNVGAAAAVAFYALATRRRGAPPAR